MAFSEIEDFPRAVLAHHYPDVPLHGDFTVLRDQPWIVNADVLVGGTPCQAFSVAGLRNSLSDERGNLSLEFVRLADAIDTVRKLADKDAAVIVWENVPGVLSVKDNAFGCFLGALAGEDEAIVPSGKRWTNAGLVLGPKRAVAWRILDAQYFGLAQRRRRVFVVASARDGFDPAAVLLEFEGVRRDTPPRRETWKDPASRAASGADQRRSHWDGVEHPHPTLNQSFNTGAIGYSNQELFSQRGAGLVGEASTGDISHYLNAGGMGRQDYETETLVTHALRGEGFDGSEDGTGRGTPLVPVAFHPTQDPISSTDGSTHALGCGSKNGQASVAVAYEPIPINSMNAMRSPDAAASTGCGVGEAGEAMFTLTKGNHHAVAVPLQEVGKRTGVSTDDPRAGIGIGQDGDPMYTLQAGAQHGVAVEPFTLAIRGRGDTHNLEARQDGLANALLTPNGGRAGIGVGAVAAGMAVRRLTPVECERLQGFPDSYTMIPWKNRLAEECPDGPRYKALGNSMAVPCMAWIGRRIANALA